MAGTFGAGLLGMGGGAVIGGSIVRLFLDTKQFDAALAKTKGETEATAASGGSAMGKFSLLATAAYAAAAYAAVKFATSSVKAYQESEAANAQTVAVLKSTGEAAGMTYDAILNLAKGFQQTTTYSDEAVQSAENLILTFKSIGSDIFPQTTQAVLDMSTALGQDLKSSAIQLGKALEDPTIGLTALRRVGVSFSADQVTLIKSLVATNDLLGAQKIILTEVGAEFGGSASAAATTFAGKIEQLKNRFNDIQESVGHFIVNGLSVLLPALGDLLSMVDRLKVPLIGMMSVFAGYKVLTLFHAGLVSIAGGLQAIGAATSTGLSGVGILGVLSALGSSIAAIASANPVGVAVGLTAIGDALAGPISPDQAVVLEHYAMALERIQTTFPAFATAGPEFNQFLSDLQFSMGQIKQSMSIGMSGPTLIEDINRSGEVTQLNDELTKAGSSARLTAQDLADLATGGSAADVVVAKVAASFGTLKVSVDKAGRIVHTFARMTGKDLATWQADVSKNFAAVIGDATSFSNKWTITGHKYAQTMRQMTAAGDRLVTDQKKLEQQVRQHNTPAFEKYAAALALSPVAMDAYIHSSTSAQTADFKQWKQQQQNQGQYDKTTTSLGGMTTKTKSQTTALSPFTTWLLTSSTAVDQLSASIKDLPLSKTVDVNINIKPANAGALSTVIDQRIAAAIAGLKTG